MEKVYLDSCVYISYLKGELNDESYFLFERIFNKEFRLIISTKTLEEIRRKSKEFGIFEECKELILEIKRSCIYEIIKYKKEDVEKSKKINIHFPDSLHIILAIRENCGYIITYDKEFLKYNNEIKIKHPKEF